MNSNDRTLACCMPDLVTKSSKRVLEPYDRVSEVLFGMIMVLTITGSLSVADAGRDDVRTMLIGALGCNLAWGIIDGLLYLMGSLSEQARNLRSLRALREATAPPQAKSSGARALVDPPALRVAVRCCRPKRTPAYRSGGCSWEARWSSCSVSTSANRNPGEIRAMALNTDYRLLIPSSVPCQLPLAPHHHPEP